MINEASRFRLYKEGASDREIADAEGRAKGTITSWRRRKKLPANRPFGRPRTHPEEKPMLQWLRLGSNGSDDEDKEPPAVHQGSLELNLAGSSQTVSTGIEGDGGPAYKSGGSNTIPRKRPDGDEDP